MNIWNSRTIRDDQGTFGHWYSADHHWFSGELPWRNNDPNISSIPTGIFPVEWTLSNRFGRYTYEVKNVPGRSGVRLHVANFVGDRALGFKAEVEGCITLGLEIVSPGWIPKADEHGSYSQVQRALKSSAAAIAEFEKYMDGKPFTLYVEDKVGH